MKTTKSWLMPLALMCLFITSSFFSNTAIAQQEDPPVYFSVAYMKVKPENVADYKKLEAVWKKMHEMRVKDGKLSNWFFYEILSPFGSSTEYNFIAMNQYVGREMYADSYESGSMMSFFDKLTPEEQELVKRTGELREMVKEEIYRARDFTGNGSNKPSKICVVNYMKLKEGYRGRDLGKMENTYWKPLHEHRIKESQMAGWGMYSKELPYGTASEYSVTTVDFFDSISQMLALPDNNFLAQFKKVHPDKKIEDMMEETGKVRSLVKAEVWRLIDYTDVPAAEIKTAKK